MNPIIETGNRIFKTLSSMDVYDRYNYLCVNEEKFLKLYPNVARHMCLNEYSPQAFGTILRKQQDTNLKLLNEKDSLTAYFENQALYSKLLCEEKFGSKKKCDRVYQEALNELWANRLESERAIKTYTDKRSAILKSEFINFLTDYLTLTDTSTNSHKNLSNSDVTCTGS